MNGNDVLLIVTIIVLLILLAFLAAAETAISRTSKVKAQALIEERPGKSSRALARLVEHPERFINPLLVTVSALQIAQSALTTLLADSLFGTLGVVIGLVLNLVVFFVVSESLPKTYALLATDRAALLTARPTYWLSRFPPLRWVSRALIGITNVIIPGRGLRQGPFVSESELLGIVSAAAEDEVIEHEERELIQSIIEFGDTVVREVMVPRPDMKVVPSTETVSGTLDKAIQAGVSRLPVIGDSIDDIVGIAYIKDLMRAERTGHGAEPAGLHARPGKFMPESKPVAHAMREMQADKFHMALVVDEYGGIAGLVTLEDCIEELVGEIVDEYDVEQSHVEELADGDLRVDGGLDIDDLNERLGTHVPSNDWDTVAGFVLGILGHVPDEGEQVEFEGHTFTADKVEGRRIATVRISTLEGWQPDGWGDDGDEQ